MCLKSALTPVSVTLFHEYSPDDRTRVSAVVLLRGLVCLTLTNSKQLKVCMFVCQVPRVLCFNNCT